MRVVFSLFCLCVALFADVELKNINTSLYSKSGNNVLKDISISLDFEGVDLNKNKLLDATNSVISAFFYEDIFTELGKNAFKKTLIKVLDKKYHEKVDAIYILKLSNNYKYDTKSLKEFLEKELGKEAPKELLAPKSPTIKQPKPISTPKPPLIKPALKPEVKKAEPLKDKEESLKDYFKDAPNLPKSKKDSKLSKLPSINPPKPFKMGDIPDADTIKKDADTMRKLIAARQKKEALKKAKIPEGNVSKKVKKPLGMPFNKGRNLNATPVERGSLPASQDLLLKEQMQKLQELNSPLLKKDKNLQENLEKIKANMGVNLQF